MKKLIIVVLLLVPTLGQAAEFFCPSGDVTCLVASINDANALPGHHVINLEPGIYTLPMLDNSTDGSNGLPSITGSIEIKASADDPPTVIDTVIDTDAPPGMQRFRIFHIAVGGDLMLEGLVLQKGLGQNRGAALYNRGTTSLTDSVVTDSITETGALYNVGTLNIIKSIIAHNSTGHAGGGIRNEAGGTVLVENSTIAHNISSDGGGIGNAEGTVVVRNSAIIFNSTDGAQAGAGIHNNGGAVEIFNTTIAKNVAGQGGGGVFASGGTVSITNSTIRENQAQCCGGGIRNGGNGVVQLQNTIVAGNVDLLQGLPGFRPDCLGTIPSLGNNLVGDPTGCGINLQSTDRTGDPGLDELVGIGEEDLPGRAYYPVLAERSY